MAIPTYVGAVTTTGTGTSTSPNIATIASGSPPTAGDLILVEVSRASSSSTVDQHLDAPAGYHRLGSIQISGIVAALFWKIREGGDSNTPTFSWSVSDAFICTVHCVRGTDQTRPICRQSINRISSSTTFSWLAETTPVADCLALALLSSSGNRAGSTPASGFTERVDTGQAGGSTCTQYAQSQGFATVSSNTGSASVTIGSGSGTAFFVARMILLQPPQTATPKDVRVATGTLTSPTSTGTQNVTGLGFDCKALIVYGVALNSGTTDNNVWSQGIGADDGVTTAAQRCVGFNVFENAGGQGCRWSRNGEIICAFLPGNQTSPDLLASFSRITDGFSLNWLTVQATGYVFNYIALGGADIRAMCGAHTMTSALGDLPWRPSFAHIIGNWDTVDADSVTNDVTVAANSYGWLDCNTGAACCLSISDPDTAIVRDNSFYSQHQGGSLAGDCQFSQTSSTGWAWNSPSNSKIFFYLACQVVGADTYFPFQVELLRADSSGTNGANQVVPGFGVGQSFTTKKLVHQIIGINTTGTSKVAHAGGTGHVKFSYAVVDTDAVYCEYISSTDQTRGRLDTAGFYAPGKVGNWSDTQTINWATNDTTARIIGLFTLGFIGQAFTVSAINDTVAVTDSASRSLTRSRQTGDTVAVADSIARTLTRSRSATDTSAVTELLARTTAYARNPSDTVAVTDSAARTITRSRQVSDTAVATESLARTATHGRKTSDTVAVSDSFARTATYGRNPSDTVAVVESLARALAYGRTQGDAAVVTELLARTATYDRKPGGDTVAVSDSLSVVADRSRTINDAASAVDAVSTERSIALTISNSLSTTDQVSPLFATSANDSVAVADQLALKMSIAVVTNDTAALVDRLGPEFATALSDAPIVGDTLKVALELAVAVGDASAISDALATVMELAVTVSDALTLTDELKTAAELAPFVVDLVNVIDVVTLQLAIDRDAGNDAVAVVDNIEPEFVEGSTRVDASDDIAVSDALAVTSVKSSTGIDTVSMTDSVSAMVFAGIELVSADTLATADLLALELAYAITLSDDVLVTDVISNADAERSVNNAVSVADLLALEMSIARSVTDDLAVTDHLAAEKLLSLSDVVDVFDALTVLRTLGLSDAATITDTFFVELMRQRGATDHATLIDVLRVEVPYARMAIDSVDVEDSAITGEMFLTLYGVDASPGPIVISTIE